MDWENLQMPSVTIEIQNNMVVNNFRIINAEAESTGLELEIQGLATDNLLLGGSLGRFFLEDGSQPTCFEAAPAASRPDTSDERKSACGPREAVRSSHWNGIHMMPGAVLSRRGH